MPKTIKKKGKKKRKSPNPSKRWKHYKIEEGKAKPLLKFCPRCGPGIFLAKSKSGDRIYCGRCHYTEFSKK